MRFDDEDDSDFNPGDKKKKPRERARAEEVPFEPPPAPSFNDRPPRRDFGGGGGGGGGNFADRGPREPLENHEGTVKFFNGERGFGFVTPDGGGADVFVHISAVQRSGLETLEPGQRIAFQTLPDRFGKGPKAINLSILGGAGGGQPASPANGDQPDMGDYNPE